MKKTTALLNVNGIDLSSSIKLFQDLSVKTTSIFEQLPPINAENKDFDEKFLGGLIKKPNYKHCRFNKTVFESANGSYSNMSNCFFEDVLLNNCDFRYSSFEKCNFNCNKKLTISSCNLSYSKLTNCIFNKVSFSGTSFRHMIINNVEFNECTINSSSFEHTRFEDCIFVNIDFRNVGVRYCEFINCKFINIVFPVLDILSNYGLIETINNYKYQTKISLGNNGVTNYDEAIKVLSDLVPYYQEAHDYFELINLCIIHNESKIVEELIPQGLAYVIKQNDFEGLENLCKLLVSIKNTRFSKVIDNVDLNNIYNLIVELIDPEKLPYNLYKSYVDYISNIRLLLVDNPNREPVGQIILQTNINPEDTKELAEFMSAIDKEIRALIPSATPYIQVSHHCPYEIIVAFVGALPVLLQTCQLFYYTFGGLKSLKDIAGSCHEKAEKNKNTNKKTNKEFKGENKFSFESEKRKFSVLFKFETKVETMEYHITE